MISKDRKTDEADDAPTSGHGPFPLLPGTILALAALFVLVPGTTRATDKVLIFDYKTGGWPPYVMVASDGAVSGVTRDILTEALAGMGWKLKITFHPELRGQELLDRDEVDARGKAREWVPDPDDYYWSAPILTPSEVLVSPSDAPLHSPTAETLRGRSIATMRGFGYPGMDEAFGNGATRRVDVDSPHKQLFLVRKTRVDGALMNRLTAQWLMRTEPFHNPSDYFIAPAPLTTFEYRLMFSKKRDWRPFIKRFDARIRAMRENGSIDRTLRRYR